MIDMGELQICPLQDGAMRLRTAAVYPPSGVSSRTATAAPAETLTMTFGGFLIRTRSRRIIVDLGAGHEFELPTTLGQVTHCGTLPASSTGPAWPGRRSPTSSSVTCTTTTLAGPPRHAWHTTRDAARRTARIEPRG